MKKLLLILIIPFLSFGQDCDLESLTYVPDDSFENYIETNFPYADNGVANDNYVVTAGLAGESAFTEMFLTPLYLDAPIFDLTGIEAFHSNIYSIYIASQPVSTIDLSCLNIVSSNPYGSQEYLDLTIDNCALLEEIILPSDTVQSVRIGAFSENNSLSNIVFPNDIKFASFNNINENCISTYITIGDSNLCLDINGEALCPISVIINSDGVDKINFSDFTIAYDSSLVLYNLDYDSPPGEVNLIGPNTFYWTNVAIGGNFNCVQVDNPNYCELSESWQYGNSFGEGVYSADCYNYIDCADTSTIVDSPSLNKSLLKTIDILGRETINQGLQLHIYDDGSVEKKYLIK